MIVIGELINGARPEVARAILDREQGPIQQLARQQAEAGCDYLDVCAGTPPRREAEDLGWLVEVVQETVDLPLCLDSAHPQALVAAAGSVRHGLVLNSVSGEREKLDALIPLAARLGSALLCLALDELGIPAGAEQRVEILSAQVHEARRVGIPDERLFLDPLTLTVGTDTAGSLTTLEVIRSLRREFPKAHVCTAVSNVSFGLPGRSLLNRAFLTLALGSGLDAAILNPLDRELRGALLATQTLLDQDRFCRTYTTAFRRGVIGRRA